MLTFVARGMQGKLIQDKLLIRSIPVRYKSIGKLEIWIRKKAGILNYWWGGSHTQTRLGSRQRPIANLLVKCSKNGNSTS